MKCPRWKILLPGSCSGLSKLVLNDSNESEFRRAFFEGCGAVKQ